MIIVKEVDSKKTRKQFVEFPNHLYKNNKCYVPELYGDAMKIFGDKNRYKSVMINKCFLAYRDEEVAGRIECIIQLQYNQINNEKRVRFDRFDCINDFDVAKALFDAAVNWSKSNGMDTICGPLGYSDLEREGLLIEGFDEVCTFEEQYTASYYPKLIEQYGFEKEVDWFEFELKRPQNVNPMIEKVSNQILQKYHFKLCDNTISKRKYIKKYTDDFFRIIDDCYKNLYGFVPFNDQSMRKKMLSQYRIAINKKYLRFIENDKGEVIAMGFAIPSLSEALYNTGGHLSLRTCFKLLRAIKKPKKLDLALVGVLPEYQLTGINAVFLNIFLNNFMLKDGIESLETNLNLEYNTSVMEQWKYFDARNHKKRRSYIYHI